MIVLYLLASYFVCYAAATSTVIRMPRGTYTIPVEFIPVEGNETIEGSAIFQVFSIIHENGARPGPYNFAARGFVVGEDRTPIYFDRPVMIPRNGDRSLVLPGAPGSESAWTRSMECFRLSFLFSPSLEDVLVLNPSNPTEYAYEGQIWYTPMDIVADISFTKSWPIRTAARFTGNGSLSTQLLSDANFVRSSLKFDWEEMIDYITVPLHLRSDLFILLGSMGIQASVVAEVPYTLDLYHMDPDRISAFPSMEIIIQAEDGSHVQIALIQPTDYITPTDISGVYQIVFNSYEDRFALTNRIVQNLLVHFDYPNHRIGFADPLVEL